MSAKTMFKNLPELLESYMKRGVAEREDWPAEYTREVELDRFDGRSGSLILSANFRKEGNDFVGVFSCASTDNKTVWRKIERHSDWKHFVEVHLPDAVQDLRDFCEQESQNRNCQLQKANETVETSYPEPPEFVAQGDRVLLVGVATGKIKAANKTFEDQFAFSVTVRNGKLTNIQEYIDTQALALASRVDPS